MKRFRLALIVGVLATACLISSFAFFHVSRTSAQYSEKKYLATMRVRTEGRAYREKLETLGVGWERLGELSRESGADVSYDISIEPNDFGELNDKVMSTYEHGFFFLKRAVLEGTPEGVRLAVSGFKRGDCRQ
ncbi:MAG TPA: hypothetical protein PKM41_02915 [Deltaproteobacteria bacterium]|jgi:hypothetical protein|nr:hypothetical protein [Deltaproteobacteria bacterium]HOI05806.1 hypothetical protein [Deltaproteobacteria bacterium]